MAESKTQSSLSECIDKDEAVPSSQSFSEFMNGDSAPQTEVEKPKEVSVAEVVNKFLSDNPVRVLIGTPCYAGQLHTGYFQSMIDLAINFTKLNIPFEVINIGNESLIPRARNGIVAKFLGEKTYTHLMFIDADITFSWVSVLRLILNNKDLTGGVYPKKHLNWGKIIRCAQRDPTMNSKEIIARSVDYVFNPVYFNGEENKLMAKVVNGFVQVKDVPTGFMMIKRNVFDSMMHKYPERKYNNNVAGYHTDDTAEYFYNFFDTEIDQEAKVYLSEDYLFCKLWRECGGDLWVDLSTNLNHTGSMDFIGSLQLTIGEEDDLNEDTVVTKNTISSSNTNKK
jgi:hypothetical protein